MLAALEAIDSLPRKEEYTLRKTQELSDSQ